MKYLIKVQKLSYGEVEIEAESEEEAKSKVPGVAVDYYDEELIKMDAIPEGMSGLDRLAKATLKIMLGVVNAANQMVVGTTGFRMAMEEVHDCSKLMEAQFDHDTIVEVSSTTTNLALFKLLRTHLEQAEG